VQTIAALASDEKNHEKLAKAGAVGILEKAPTIRGRRNILKIGDTVSQQGREGCSWATDEEWKHIVHQKESYAQWRGSVPSQIEYFLDSTGLTMYGYTVAGGASWGLIRGIQTGLSGRAMIQAIGRTAFITGLAPALFVGLFVNGFTHFRRQCQSKERVQGLVLGTTWLTGSSIVFMHRYVTHVSPYWLGAHVLGFGLFGLSQIDRVSIGDIISAFNLGLSGGSNSPGASVGIKNSIMKF